MEEPHDPNAPIVLPKDPTFYMRPYEPCQPAPECPAPPSADELQKQIADLTALVQQLLKK
jgi:hypothetical protein